MTPLFALLFDSVDQRLRLRKPARKTLNKVFPHHWSFLLGEVAVFSFVILVLTGTYLTFFYRASTDPVIYTGSSSLYDGVRLPAAYESVIRLSNDVPGGLLFRRLHRGASHLFIASTVLHMLRILLTGAFRQPREPNYLLGIVLFMITLGSGFTGYSLLYDSLAGTGIRIAYSSLLAFPFIGDQLAFWVFGGEFPTGDVIPRFFVLHVMLLPGLLIGLVGLHLAILVRQRHTQFPRRGVDGHQFILGKPLWPSQVAESATLVLWIGGLLAVAAVLVPWSDVSLLGPYVPGEVGNNAQPDWFMFWLDGMLRMFPAFEWSLPGVTINGVFVAGILLPGLVFGALILYPFLEKRVYRLEGDWHVLQNPLDIPLRAGFGLGTFSAILFMSAAATSDQLSRITGVPIEGVLWFWRIMTLFAPPLLALAIYRYSRRRLARRDLEVAPGESAESQDLAGASPAHD
ncbi:MAG: cytochrome b [Nitriliruptorales bacterium]|nr:cytochrome b [Nitriliruptorales bacterium]